jgi:hypothetical protein
MTTIVRQSYSIGPCRLLGELIEDTAFRYYGRRFGDALVFADKRSPAIHIVPCRACPDWVASQRYSSPEE